MGKVIPLVGYRPSPRYPPDDDLWTLVGIEESAALPPEGEHGTEIDSVAMPPYADPAAPPLVNVSTSAGDQTLTVAYYRLVFYDAFDGEQATEWVYSGPSYLPGAAELRAMSQNNVGGGFDWTRFGYGPPHPGEADRLEGVAARAVAYVQLVTGRTLDANLPPDLRELVHDAVLMRAQQLVIARGSTRGVRDALDSQGLASLRAGDFQVTWRDGSRKAGETTIRLNPWGELSDTLWLLMTPEKRAEYLAEVTGQAAPAAAVVETVADSWPYGYS